MSGCLFASVNGRVMGALILQMQSPLGICLLQAIKANIYISQREPFV